MTPSALSPTMKLQPPPTSSRHAWWQHGRRICGAVETVAARSYAYPLWCVVSGMLGGSVLGTTVTLSPLLLGSLLALLGLGCVCLRPLPHVRRCCGLALVGGALTAFPLAWEARPLPAQHVAALLPTRQALTVDGTLAYAVEVAGGEAYYVYVHVSRVYHAQAWQARHGLIRLKVHASDIPWLPGDVLRFTRLRLHLTHSMQNPDGFDWQRFMAWKGIHVVGGVSKLERVQILHRPDGFLLARTLALWRQHLRTSVSAVLAPPYDAVFLAMVLGYRGGLSTGIQEQFRVSGTSHLLVVSGLNVSCIALSALWVWRALLRRLRSWLPRAWFPGWYPTPLAALLSLPPVVVYCSLVGWEVPTTRAALMTGSYLLALSIQRSRAPMQALLLAAALILLFEPAAVRDVSFQLSFVAVASIVLVSQRLTAVASTCRGLRRWCHYGYTYLAVNTAAFLGTLPILVGTFHTLPTFALLANMPLVLIAGVITQLGTVTLVACAVWPALTTVLYTLLMPLLRWTVTLTAAIAHWPAAQFFLAAPSWVMLSGYYGLLGSVLCWSRLRYRWWCASGCLLLVVTGALGQYISAQARHLRVTFVDVGTGDAILVQWPGNHHLLIDGGGTHDGRFDIGRQILAPLFWQRYIRHFDLVALTHMHTDHARGLVSVLRHFPTRFLLTNGSPMRVEYLRDLLALGQAGGAQHLTALESPRHWEWDGVSLAVLAPPPGADLPTSGWAPTSENDRSLVLRMQYGAVRFLFPGDIEQGTERWLVTQGLDLRADILKVPHHGSQTSTSPAFLQRVRPQVGIISVGADNPHGHPHRQVLEVLTQHGVAVWRTDTHGAITITSDGTGYEVHPWRPYRPQPRVAQP